MQPNLSNLKTKPPPLFKPFNKPSDNAVQTPNVAPGSILSHLQKHPWLDTEASKSSNKPANATLLSFPGIPAAKPLKNIQDRSERVSSLEKLHHSNSTSAFKLIDAQSLEKPRGQASLCGSLDSSQSQLPAPSQLALISRQPQLHTVEERIPDNRLLQFKREQQRRQMIDSCAANRKAAIIRFKAKRTQRNFEKKVRYASRQKLAHSRPRVKGQFVKGGSSGSSAASDARDSPTSFLNEAAQPT